MFASHSIQPQHPVTCQVTIINHKTHLLLLKYSHMTNVKATHLQFMQQRLHGVKKIKEVILLFHFPINLHWISLRSCCCSTLPRPGLSVHQWVESSNPFKTIRSLRWKQNHQIINLLSVWDQSHEGKGLFGQERHRPGRTCQLEQAQLHTGKNKPSFSNTPVRYGTDWLSPAFILKIKLDIYTEIDLNDL